MLLACHPSDPVTEGRTASTSARASGQPRVVTAVVESCTIVEHRRLVGEIVDRGARPLAFSESARLESLHVDVGSHVEAGTLLARLDTRYLRARVAIAKSGLRVAEEAQAQGEREVERSERLLARGSVGEADAERRRSSLSRARAEVSLAESELRAMTAALHNAELRAPVAGTVAEIQVAAGEVVGAGHAVLRLDPDMPNLAVRARIPEHLVERFEVDTQLQGRVRRSVRFTAKVRWIGAVDRGQELLADLEPGPRQRAGLSVDLQVPDDDTAQLCVPLRAITHVAPDRTGAFVVDHTNHLEFRNVEVGRWDARRITVVHGLAEGERVVVDGFEGLRDRLEVAPESEQERP
jgi:membrane fusion protein, multidrug efflux system